MSQKIDLDHGRFRQIIRGKIKQNLRKYISQGEMIAKKGKDTVSIPMPSGRHPALQARRQAAGRRRPGRRRARRPARPGDGEQPGAGRGRRPPRRSPARGRGHRCRSSPRSSARSSSCRASSPRAPRRSSRARTSTRASARPAPSRCATSAARSSRRCAARSRWAPTTRRTRSSSRSATTSAIARGEASRCRSRNAVIIYMMDVSGSMGDEQKEIVRIESFWIDTWLRSQYHGIESRYIIHDAMAQGGRSRHLLPDPRVGRHDDQLGVQAVREDDRRRVSARAVEHLSVPLLRRRQLVGRRHAHVRRAAEERSSCRT